MDISRFVAKNPNDLDLLSDLTCALCSKICVDTMSCQDAHLFCRTCIEHHLSHSSTCPVDASPLTNRDLIPNKFSVSYIHRLTVRCQYFRTPDLVFAVRSRLGRPAGCRWIGSFTYLEKHVKECPFRPVTCQHCAKDGIPFLALESHLRLCEDRYTKCRMCDEDILVRDEERHGAVCPEANIICPNHCLVARGISNEVSLIRRKDLNDHLEKCPRRIVSCDFRDVGCIYEGYKEAIRAHLIRDWPEHVNALRTQLVKARASIDELAQIAEDCTVAVTNVKAELADVKDELAEVKRVLGGRCRSDDDADETQHRFKVRKTSPRLDETENGIAE